MNITIDWYWACDTSADLQTNKKSCSGSHGIPTEKKLSEDALRISRIIKHK